MTTPLSDERIAELTYRLKGPVTSPLDWWCEADDLFTVGCELLAEVTRLRTRNVELVAVLREVEWKGPVESVETEDGYRTARLCPRCLGDRLEDHAPDCALDAALRGAGE